MALNTSSGTTSSSDVFGAFSADGLVGQAPIIPFGAVIVGANPPSSPPSPSPPPPPPPPPPPLAPSFGVLSGQTSTGIVLASGSHLGVDSGGIAINTTVQAGGWIMVSGGVTSATTLSGYAATEYAYSGSTLIDTTIYNGGSINLQPGGHLQGLTTIYSGGGIGGAAVDSGGTLLLSAGAQAVGITTVSAGGTVVIESGATISGTNMILSGGTLEIQSGGALGTTIVQFASGGTLKLDNSPAFWSILSGFDGTNEIDLADMRFSPDMTTLAYSSGGRTGLDTFSNSAGELTIGNGSQTAQLTLIGQYAAANFIAIADGHGGTAIHNAVTALSSDPVQFTVAKITS